LLRLPHSLWCYRPASDMPEVQPLPALQNGYITFGSFNNSNKIDRLSIELWAGLLRALPRSRLLMVAVPDGEARQRLVQQFEALGIAPERLEIHGKLPGKDFFRMLQRADVTLDPVSVNGATTTCESLWLGVPVISLRGTRFVSRAGFSIMSAAGLDDFVAGNENGYIETAVRLAGDVSLLAEIRRGLRAKLAASALMDEAGFARNLERLYRDIWTKWCASAGAPT
jgi:protein O-GlcNAc transferase